jgi:hypothetical protein
LHALLSLFAAKALRLNFTELLPKVMPLREMAAFGANYVSRKLLGRHSVKPYRPDLQKCAKHICIHTGMLISEQNEDAAAAVAAVASDGFLMNSATLCLCALLAYASPLASRWALWHCCCMLQPRPSSAETAYSSL